MAESKKLLRGVALTSIFAGAAALVSAIIQFDSPPRGNVMRFLPYFNLAVALLQFLIAAHLIQKARRLP